MTYMAELTSTRVTSDRRVVPNKQVLIFLSFSSMVESLFWTTEIKIRLWKFTQFILPCVPSWHSVFVLASLCMLYMLERRRQAWRWKILLAVTLLANQGVRSRGCSFRCAHSGNWTLLTPMVSLKSSQYCTVSTLQFLVMPKYLSVRLFNKEKEQLFFQLHHKI